MAVTKEVQILAPNIQVAEFKIRGTAPYVQNKFSQKARQILHDQQAAGSKGRNTGGKREGKDFQEVYQQSRHVSSEGWIGFPASAIRAAMISACRIVGYTMTKAKLSVFCEADGFDADDATPLVRIIKGEPEYFELPTRIQQTIDLRVRAKWQPGWEATVRIKFDADQFSLSDVTNLLHRVGTQVGIGEGRHDSKDSTGMGWGTFEIVE